MPSLILHIMVICRHYSNVWAGNHRASFPDLPHVILDSAECKARPVAVEVPQPKNRDAFYYPFFVTLHRCGGACSSRPFETKCQAQGTSICSITFYYSTMTLFCQKRARERVKYARDDTTYRFGQS